jgi:GrpB-like predicted nucleotidyltransferase (UPF0157 family)
MRLESRPIEIVDHDPHWTDTFATLRDQIADVLGDLAQRIEHVGSTSVAGLPAKPIIDLDVVIATRADLPVVLTQLQPLGYHHEGDLGVPGREAFTTPPGGPSHHLYVCAADSPQLANHLTFRDYLRTHPETARVYADLKQSLAQRLRADRSAYAEGKTAFIEQALTAATQARNSSGDEYPYPIAKASGQF